MSTVWEARAMGAGELFIRDLPQSVTGRAVAAGMFDQPVTTLACGEECNDVTTLAVGEECGC
jgi:hypothetical protein